MIWLLTALLMFPLVALFPSWRLCNCLSPFRSKSLSCLSSFTHSSNLRWSLRFRLLCVSLLQLLLFSIWALKMWFQFVVLLCSTNDFSPIFNM